MIVSQKIAQILKAPLSNVDKYWPILWQCFHENGMDDKWPTIVNLATIGVETGAFAPVAEYGDAAYFKKTYGNRPDYEVDNKGLWKWRGRGFIQLTGKDNYTKYGKALNLDLVTCPDLALEEIPACDIFSCYVLTHQLPQWARKAGAASPTTAEAYWRQCRKQVNGGYNGYAKFRQLITDFTSVWT